MNGAILWDVAAFSRPWLPIQRGHKVYSGVDGHEARERLYAMAARLNKWKRSYAVYLLKDGRPVSSITK